jgi:hypothetical protein
MKVGRGLFGLMSNIRSKYRFHGRSPILYTTVLVALGFSLVLLGCGDFSLNQLLENEDTGEFTVNPQTVNLEVGKELTLTGSGGFKPYRFLWISGPNPDDLDTQQGVYKAPDSIGGSTELVLIKGVDYFDAETVAQITVHNPLTLNKTSHTMTDSQTFDFDASGGVGSYTFTLDGVVDPSLNSSTGVFTPTAPGIYNVEVTDSIDNMAIARVTVLESGTGLAIDPVAANVVIDGPAVTFMAVNKSGPSVTFTRDPAIGTLNQVGDQATFSVSSPASPGTVTITLQDSDETVTAQVNVVTTDPGPFDVIPAPYNPGYAIEEGSDMTFTVLGGVRSYSFGLLDKDGVGGPLGTLEILSPTIEHQQVIFHAPEREINVWVTFSDSAGAYEEVKVKVQD